MAKKTPDVSRRTFLRGTGAVLGLPFLESLSFGATAAELPRRMAFVYFPFGVALPKEKDKNAAWNWFPSGEGKDFKFRRTLESLEPLRGLRQVDGSRHRAFEHPVERRDHERPPRLGRLDCRLGQRRDGVGAVVEVHVDRQRVDRSVSAPASRRARARVSAIRFSSGASPAARSRSWPAW